MIRDLYLSGVWLGMDLRMDTKTTCVKKSLDNMLRICLTTGNLIARWAGTNLKSKA